MTTKDKLQSEAVKQKPKELDCWKQDWEKFARENSNSEDSYGCDVESGKIFISNLLTQQRTELEKKFKKDKKQPKDKLGDDFTKFLESEGYQVRDCEVEKCNHKWIQIEYDLMKCLKCNKVKKL